MYWYGPFQWLIFFLIIGLGIYLVIKYEIVVIGKRSGKTKQIGIDTETRESPLHILEKRYVRGEITEEEFQKIKKSIEGKL